MEHSPDMNAARNPATSQKELDRLATCGKQLVQALVTQNPSTSVETLVKISKDEKAHPMALRIIARNSAVPVEIIEEFLSSEANSIAKAAASNALFNLSRLNSLLDAQDCSKAIISGILDNPNINTSLISRIIDNTVIDENKPELPEEEAEILNKALGHSSVDAKHLLYFSKSQNDKLRAAVVRNPSCSSKILSSLVHDEAQLVKKLSLAHPATPIELSASYWLEELEYIEETNPAWDKLTVSVNEKLQSLEYNVDLLEGMKLTTKLSIIAGENL